MKQKLSHFRTGICLLQRFLRWWILPADAEFVAKNAEKDENFLKSSNVSAIGLIRATLVAGLPSTCIKNDNGDIVAHNMLIDFHLRYLWVDPKVRGKNFAKFIAAEQAKKVLQILPKVVTGVKVENERTVKLQAKLGWIDLGFNSYWEHFLPNSNMIYACSSKY